MSAEVTLNEQNDFVTYNTKWNEANRLALAAMDPGSFAGPNNTFPIQDSQDVALALNLAKFAENPQVVTLNILTLAQNKGLVIPTTKTVPAQSGTITVYNGEHLMTKDQARALAANCSCQNTRRALLSFAGPVANSPMKSPESMSDDELKGHHKRVMSEVMKRHSGLSGGFHGEDSGQDADDAAEEGEEDIGSGKDIANDKEMHSFDDGPVDAGSQQSGGKGTKDEYPPNVDDMPNRNQRQPGFQPSFQPSKRQAAVTSNQSKATLTWLRSNGAPQHVIEQFVANERRQAAEKHAFVQRIINSKGITDANEANRVGRILFNRSLSSLEAEYGPELRRLSYNSSNPVPLYNGASGNNGSVQNGGMGPRQLTENEAEPTTNWEEVYKQDASPYLLARLNNQVPNSGN